MTGCGWFFGAFPAWFLNDNQQCCLNCCLIKKESDNLEDSGDSAERCSLEKQKSQVFFSLSMSPRRLVARSLFKITPVQSSCSSLRRIQVPSTCAYAALGTSDELGEPHT